MEKNKFLVLIVLCCIGIFVLLKQPHASLQKPEIKPKDYVVNTQKERELWTNRIRSVGSENAYKEFKTAYAATDYNTQHLAAHLFGEILYDTAGLKGITVCDNDYIYGCYHGFFRQFIAKGGKEDTQKLEQECLDKFKNRVLECTHGIGHGLMEYFGPKKLLSALEGCSPLKTEQPVHGCKDGVFMEYNNPLITTDGTVRTNPRTLDKNDIYAPCPSIPKEFRQSCYYWIIGLWKESSFMTVDKMIGFCAALEDAKEKNACIQGIGKNIPAIADFDVDKTIEMCKKTNTPEEKKLCLIEASWSFFGDTKVRSIAGQVCKDLDDADKKNCPQ